MLNFNEIDIDAALRPRLYLVRGPNERTSQMTDRATTAEKAVLYTAEQLATLTGLLEHFIRSLDSNTDAVRDLERELSRR